MESSVVKVLSGVNKKRRGRPPGSKNKNTFSVVTPTIQKKAKRAVKTSQKYQAQSTLVDKDGLTAALGLLLVAVDILKRTVG